MNARFLAVPILITVLASAQTSTAPAPPSASASQDVNTRKARQILDQMIQTLGGQAYMSVQDMSQEGRGYSFSHGKPDSLGTVYWLFWKFPDKQRVEVTKQRDIVTINNGDEGYEVTYRGTALEEKEQLQAYQRYRKHSLENVLRVWLDEAECRSLLRRNRCRRTKSNGLDHGDGRRRLGHHLRGPLHTSSGEENF